MNFNCLLKNRTFIGAACIILSLLICFGLTPLFNSALKAQTEIIRVTKDIKKGDAIAADKIEKVKVGAYNLPGNVVKNADELKGKFAAADLMTGDYILTSKLTDNPYEENEYLYKLDGTKEAISVSIKSFALGLSGKLKSGDIVSIIASDYGEMRETKIPPELQYVEVLAVTNAKGMDENVQVKDTKNNEEKQLPSTVTLLVNMTQAKILADLEAKSKIHMALVYRGNPENAKKFLEVQDEMLKKQESANPKAVLPQSAPTQNPILSSTQTPVVSSGQGGRENVQ